MTGLRSGSESMLKDRFRFLNDAYWLSKAYRYALQARASSKAMKPDQNHLARRALCGLLFVTRATLALCYTKHNNNEIPWQTSMQSDWM